MEPSGRREADGAFDAYTSDSVVDGTNRLRLRNAGQEPGGSPEGLPHEAKMLLSLGYRGQFTAEGVVR
jgi:hypothetical protein